MWTLISGDSCINRITILKKVKNNINWNNISFTEEIIFANKNYSLIAT